jgi:hypothetical protein
VRTPAFSGPPSAPSLVALAVVSLLAGCAAGVGLVGAAPAVSISARTSNGGIAILPAP